MLKLQFRLGKKKRNIKKLNKLTKNTLIIISIFCALLLFVFVIFLFRIQIKKKNIRSLVINNQKELKLQNQTIYIV